MSGVTIGCQDHAVWCDIDRDAGKVELAIDEVFGTKRQVLLSADAAMMLAMHLESHGRSLGGKSPLERLEKEGLPMS